MTDADTQAAIDALAHRLRERDEAMRNGGEYADADPFAAEFMLALRAKAGWRPVAALVPPKPAPTPAETGAGSHHRRAELLAEARAHLDEINAAKKAAREELAS